MPVWKCPQDGTENPAAERRCLVCRHPNLPRSIVLGSLTSGKEAEFAEGMKFGRAVFTQRFNDPDAVLASDLQFEIVRDLEVVAWLVRPLPDAVNPTFYNGAPISPEGKELADGDVISIGKTKLKLSVRFKAN
jgi:hypothetical protein